MSKEGAQTAKERAISAYLLALGTIAIAVE